MNAYAIPLAALIISISTLVLTAVGLRSKASETYMKLLQADMLHMHQQLEDYEHQLKQCQQECQRLRQENVELLRRLVHVTLRQEGEAP